MNILIRVHRKEISRIIHAINPEVPCKKIESLESRSFHALIDPVEHPRIASIIISAL